jgi:16S rRNA (guanine527-N7)-methyltransferase
LNLSLTLNKESHARAQGSKAVTPAPADIIKKLCGRCDFRVKLKPDSMNKESRKTELNEFREALESHAGAYRVELSPAVTRGLCDYYKLLSVWNPTLHLVAPCSAKEFARRHVFESLLLLPHLPLAARVADIGSGAGLPIIPCLIARSDVSALLIESSSKKTVFLREALRRAKRADSARVIADRFENVPAPEVDFVSCRALDRFEEKLPTLVKWSPRPSTLLFFGSERMSGLITGLGLRFVAEQIPFSERRFLYVISRT